jgi:hypothetical protein
VRCGAEPQVGRAGARGERSDRADRAGAADAARQPRALAVCERLFNITITNVPASPRRLYAFGAPMVDIVPIVPLAAEHSVAIAVVSYAGGVTFGVYADRATMPDLELLSDGIHTCLRELAALGQQTAAAR